MHNTLFCWVTFYFSVELEVEVIVYCHRDFNPLIAILSI